MASEEMPVLNVVLGTAGHIDHGKTALIKRLTGIDADRFKEEQARGMTIDIGYAHMVVDRRLQLGVIDVPGHERFVKNMVAGATGVGLIVLVVAADDGVMPQTREHLEIMEILGVKRGLIALTKIDLVDEDLVLLAEEELREFLAGTFLDGAPVIPVSSATGQGFDRLRQTLEPMVLAVEPPSSSGPLTLPVQRAFSAPGHGTVITGVPTRGVVGMGDVLEIQPGDRSARVRAIEAYGNRLDQARAGHRTALNLGDVSKQDIRRGDVIATPGYVRAWDSAVTRMTCLPSRMTPLKHQAPVHFHAGCAETTARASLLEGKALNPGETAFVQFRFDRPVVVVPGDGFIVRGGSPLTTLGGGKVVEGLDRRLKRNRPWVIDELGRRQAIGKGGKGAVAEALRVRQIEPGSLTEISREACLLPEETRAALEALRQEGLAASIGQGDRWLSTKALGALVTRLSETLDVYHRDHPLHDAMDKVALRNALAAGKPVFEAALERALSAGSAEMHARGVRRPGFRVELSREDQDALDRMEEAFLQGGVKPPLPSEVIAAAGRDDGETLFRLLCDRGQVVELVKNSVAIHREWLEKARALVIEEIRDKGELVAADLRDRLGTTRKYIIPLLEHFDKIGLTIRVENKRFLRETGRGADPGIDA